MKLINKIFCLFFVLAICLPVMCFPVSADDSSDYDYSYLYGTSFPDYKDSTFVEELKKVSDGPFLSGGSESGKPDLRKSKYWKEGTNGLKTKYIGWRDYNDDYYVMDNNLNNVLLLAFAKSRHGYWVDRTKPIYYYCFSYSYVESDIQIHKNYQFYFSNTPFTFTKKSNSYIDYVKLNSIEASSVEVHTFLSELNGVKYDKAYAGSGLNVNSTAVCGKKVESGSEFCFKQGEYGQALITENYLNSSRESQFFCNYNSYTFCESFSNHEIDTSAFTSGKIDNVESLASDKVLSDYIDVKLTPEFTLGMDRVFDKNTGQNDYFKLEVTNNSDTNVQFCASITEKKSEDFLKPIGGNIIDNIFKIDYEDWEDAYWNYIGDTQYYADCYKKTDKYLGIKHEYTRYAELRKGNFYWVLLKPGEKFEDFIYWENVKIKADEEYSFIVDCLPTELDYPTDVFYSMSLNTKIFPFPEELESVRNDYYRDDTLERYALNFEECVRACNYVFSVESIPNFTTTVKGGNSKITSGWKDTVSQSTNPYYREDTRTGEIIPVGNYQEFNGNLPDVDIDIDNLSVDNVKDYIRYSQNFFTLVKSVFTFAPGLWLLIVFGLTAIIIIAIVRYIRG